MATGSRQLSSLCLTLACSGRPQAGAADAKRYAVLDAHGGRPVMARYRPGANTDRRPKGILWTRVFSSDRPGV
jgi:hypothetical protein